MYGREKLYAGYLTK